MIEHGEISFVGPAAEARVPAGATVIDGMGKFVIPGLADMHDHIFTGPKVATSVESLRRLLAFGVTTVFSPAIDFATFSALKEASKSESSPYPRFYGAGPMFTVEGGHDPTQGTASFRPKTPAQARENVRELKAANVDVVKIVLDDASDRRSKLYPVLDPEIETAIIQEAHNLGLKVYAHAPIYKLAKKFMEHGGDGLVHGIADEAVEAGFVSLMRQRNAPYIATTTLFEDIADTAGFVRRQAAFDAFGVITPERVVALTDPKFIDRFTASLGDKAAAGVRAELPRIRANLRTVNEAGVLVVCGTDTPLPGLQPGTASQIELVLMVEAGLKPIDALRAATINAQKMIGREKELGSIEASKLADMVILDRDPLADIGNIRFIYRVIKRGVVFEPANILRTGAAR